MIYLNAAMLLLTLSAGMIYLAEEIRHALNLAYMEQWGPTYAEFTHPLR